MHRYRGRRTWFCHSLLLRSCERLLLCNAAKSLSPARAMSRSITTHDVWPFRFPLIRWGRFGRRHGQLLPIRGQGPNWITTFFLVHTLLSFTMASRRTKRTLKKAESVDVDENISSPGSNDVLVATRITDLFWRVLLCSEFDITTLITLKGKSLGFGKNRVFDALLYSKAPRSAEDRKSEAQDGGGWRYWTSSCQVNHKFSQWNRWDVGRFEPGLLLSLTPSK